MSVFLDACALRPTPYTPVWFMRQAGRYQPSYRALRERVSFLELCRTPALACEVTVRAVTDLGVDAAIIFADILLILEPLGVPFTFEGSDGPRITKPIRDSKEIESLNADISAENSLAFVMDAIRLARSQLQVPLIGFAGAPFTLAAYMIEGGGSRTFEEVRRFMLEDLARWQALMDRIVPATADYLNAQARAGAQALQIFDSWVGCLSQEEYRTHVQPAMKKLFSSLDANVPVIHFGTGNPTLYPLMADAGGDVIAIDWREALDEAWKKLPKNRGIMGNLNPSYVIGPRAELLAECENILQRAAGRPGHIFNLGHGILPSSSIDQVRAIVDFVHETSSKK